MCSDSCLLVVAVRSDSCLLVVAVCSDSCLLVVAVCSEATFKDCSECTKSHDKIVCTACSPGFTFNDNKTACVCKLPALAKMLLKKND